MTATPDSIISELRGRLDGCMSADAFMLQRRVRALQQRMSRGHPTDQMRTQIEATIERSTAQRIDRAASIPKIHYTSELPVVQRRNEIMRALDDHQVIVVCGETGSGKTTQLPKMCLESGRGAAGIIGHTQPRRIAARSVANRLRQEIEQGSDEGQEPRGDRGTHQSIVGYKVRFTDYTSPRTCIKVMTDGTLLAETQGDPLLSKYDTIIIDEAHERSLNIDFLLGFIRNLLPRRPDLKVIITSATIDPLRFSSHFSQAPIIEVSGRVYPVEVRYRPPADLAVGDDEDANAKAMILAVDEFINEGDGDILVFLTGERDIREAAELLRKHHLPGKCEVLPLYARLSTAEQQRVFEPHRGRRIVLATNVAETSLTVPGIRAVIDTGYARVNRYNPRTKVTRLPIEPISRASADQRKGRCGRLGPGVCIRLYSEDDYRGRPEFTEPEILRSNLAAVILQMKALGLGSPATFPFLDRPDPRHIRDGHETLLELGALDSEDRLTPLGRTLAKLPVDPRVGRMVLAGDREGCLPEVLVIASALSVQDPRDRPMDRSESADAAHARFRDSSSDFLTYLNIWDFAQNCRKHLSRSKQRKAFVEHFLSPVRMREWEEVYHQLHALLSDMGFQVKDRELSNADHESLLHPPARMSPSADRTNTEAHSARIGSAVKTDRLPPRSETVHKALLAGLLSSIGRRTADFEYTGPHGVKFTIFPGSALFRSTPKWIMAAELVRTSRLYARTAAPIKPEWIEQLGTHLLNRVHAEPRWDPQQTQAIASETGTMRSLEIYTNRRVPLGPINSKVARELFIRHALADGEYKSNAPYVRHNRALIAEADRLIAKSRDRQFLTNRQAIVDFFDSRVPQGIFNAQLFERWRKRAEATHPTLLFMSRADLIRFEPPAGLARRFPDHVEFHGSQLPVDYKFDPGAEDDGVTLTVPIEVLSSLRSEETPWLVPGLWQELITGLIRGMPAEWRRRFIPAPDFAAKVHRILAPGDDGGESTVVADRTRPFLEVIARILGQESGLSIPTSVFSFAEVPRQSLLNFRVIDEKGRTLAKGRDLDVIKRSLSPLLEQRFHRFAKGEFDRDHLTTWNFGDLPDIFTSRRHGAVMVGYPTLVDRHRSVSLCLVDSPRKAESLSRAGIRRLFVIQTRDEIVHLLRTRPNFDRLAVGYATIGSARDLREDLVLAIADRAFFGPLESAKHFRGHPDPNRPVISIRSQKAFDAAVADAWRRLPSACQELCDLMESILAAYQDLTLNLQGHHPKIWSAAIEDIREQMAFLLPPGFLLDTPSHWLDQFPRYLAAMALRLRKLTNANIARDLQRAAEANEFWSRYRRRRLRDLPAVPGSVPRSDEIALHLATASDDPELEQFRWMIEEFRVSIFAQELRTIIPISAKRLEEQWTKVRL